MLKKTILTFSFLTIFTTFYGFNTSLPVTEPDAEIVPAESIGQAVAAQRRIISDYDDVIRAASAEEGRDWRLMSAIAYHESRFEADIVSRRGAMGLMQIMPVVGRHFNVPEAEIIDPLTNVRLAGKLLNEIERTLRIPAGVPEKDRMSIVLASYNGGIGHVADARRLARNAGENPNSWDVVSRYLQLKAQPEYYEKEEVRCGRFTGSRQTLAYVDDVMARYAKYRSMTM